MHEFINDKESYEDFKEYILEDNPKQVSIIDNFIETEDVKVLVEPEYNDLFAFVEKHYPYSNSLIFGKDPTEGIVSIEVKNNTIYLFKNDGSVEERPATYWILATKPLDKHFKRLKGSNPYNFIRTFKKKENYYKYRNIYSTKDIYVVWNDAESQMIFHGFTQFKGIQVEDVSVLGFDIESSGIVRDVDSKTFIITNTFKKNGKKESVQFIVDDYNTQQEMIEDWCRWVREVDPDIITGHNIFGYDLDYLRHIMSLEGKTLELGRDGSAAKFGRKPKRYRVDGAQTWDYNNCTIFGRHVIDGMFLAVKYDIGRKYESWGLKSIIDQEGLCKEDRQFYDASQIGRNWHDPIEKEKIIEYCIDDGDDSISIFELMIPSFFYLTRSIPKPFQIIINGASGSWLNTLFVRGYLQTKDSIPKPDDIHGFEGAISYGIPGTHSNCFKQDVASLYPSIMRHYEVCEERKDYKKTFPTVVEYFTLERLKNKKIANDTKDPYYRALEQSQKIVINSLYGFMGARGLNFNSERKASFVTEMGREILNKAMKWATGEKISYWKRVVEKEEELHENDGDYDLVNCDTDSIMIKKKDESFWTKEERQTFLDKMNAEFPDLIYWEDDGYYNRVVVVKPKNYVLLEEGSDKVKIKGSSFKDAKKEIAMKEMLQEISKGLIYEKDWFPIYESYLKEVADIKDIHRWATKVSISEKLLEANDTNKQRKLAAIEGIDYQIGDKVYLYKKIDGVRPKLKNGEKQYYKKTGELMVEDNDIYCLEDKFDGDYHIPHYLKRVYATLKILENVIDIDRSPKYTLKSSFKEFEENYLS